MQMKFPQILRQQRELRGWSQSRAAQELGTTPNTISAWERGLSLPSPYFREKLCALFAKNAQELGLLPANEPPAVVVASPERAADHHETALQDRVATFANHETTPTPINDHTTTSSEYETTPIAPTSSAASAKDNKSTDGLNGNQPGPLHISYSKRRIMLLSCLLALLLIGSAIVLWPLLVAPDPYAAGKGHLVLNDPLKDQGQQLNWQEGWNENGAACQFKRNAYYVTQPLVGYFHACIAQATNFHNFAYEVEATLYQGDYIGIIFRATSSLDSKYYLFRVSRDGTYMLKRYVDRVDAHATLLDSGTSAQFHTGMGQPNALAVVADEQHLTLYINQHIVTSVIDQTYSNGQIGLLAGNDTHPPAEAAFRNARVWSW
jgi:transcriptional regulator with XRE-family HTH domain